MFKKLLERLAQLIAHYLYPYKIRNGEEQIFSFQQHISNDFLKNVIDEKYIESIKLGMIRKLAEAMYEKGFIDIKQEESLLDTQIITAIIICKKY
jgi:hypothetical protein